MRRPPLLRVAAFLDPVRYADGLRLLENLASARAAGRVPDTVLVLEVRCSLARVSHRHTLASPPPSLPPLSV